MEYYQVLIQKHWNRLKTIAERVSKNYSKDVSEEMFAEVIDKMKTIYNSFDPSRSDDIELFIFSRFGLYCRNWLSKYHAKYKRKSESGEIPESLENVDIKALAVDPSQSSALDAGDEVRWLLGVLSDKVDRRLFTLRAGYGWTFDELSAALNIPESTIRVRYNSILHQLRWYANQRLKRNIV